MSDVDVAKAARALVAELGEAGPRGSSDYPYQTSWCAVCEHDTIGHYPDCLWTALMNAVQGG